jgi:hypothetical protein
LQERYGINQKNAVGKVLWHSLNENGQIGVYDMKFGDTIIRNLTETDLIEKKELKHGVEEAHGVQEVHDPKRRKR